MPLKQIPTQALLDALGESAVSYGTVNVNQTDIICNDLLTRYRQDPEHLPAKFVTTDKSWIYHFRYVQLSALYQCFGTVDFQQ